MLIDYFLNRLSEVLYGKNTEIIEIDRLYSELEFTLKILHQQQADAIYAEVYDLFSTVKLKRKFLLKFKTKPISNKLSNYHSLLDLIFNEIYVINKQKKRIEEDTLIQIYNRISFKHADRPFNELKKLYDLCTQRSIDHIVLTYISDVSKEQPHNANEVATLDHWSFAGYKIDKSNINMVEEVLSDEDITRDIGTTLTRLIAY